MFLDRVLHESYEGYGDSNGNDDYKFIEGCGNMLQVNFRDVIPYEYAVIKNS